MNKSRLHVAEHPLVRHKLALLRDKSTDTKQFRELAEELAMLVGYEAMRDLALQTVEIETPLETTRVEVVDGQKIAVLPVLRAGLGMLAGVLRLVPQARVGHIGLYRDEDSLRPVEYYSKFPEDMSKCGVFILDPMLATGGSASSAIHMVKQAGATDIKLLCFICSHQGLTALRQEHSDIEIYTAAVDEHLDRHGFIRPGLGDAGDRLFGTR